MRLRDSVLALVAIAGFAAPSFAAVHIVEIQFVSFVPNDLYVHVGDTVVWQNLSVLQHTVTSGNPCTPDGKFATPGILNPDEEYSFTFTTPGQYPYFCTPHCLVNMRGSVTVDAPVPVKTTTWGGIKALYAINRSR